MRNEITADVQTLVRHARFTAIEYYVDLKDKFPEMSDRELVELSKVAAIDFAASILTQSIQGLTEVIERK